MKAIQAALPLSACLVLALAGIAAGAAIAEHVKQESQALPDIQAAIDKGMEDPSSTAKKWRYDRAVTLRRNITEGIKELQAIR